MTTRPDIPPLEALAESLAGTFPGCNDAPLARALLRALAHGEPVSPTTLAAVADRDQQEVSEAIVRWPNVRRDENGHVRAFGGLSLRPTKHDFEVGGRQLYTWCAWDTLFLPTLLDEPARVKSICPATGADIRLTVVPDRVLASQPQDVRVSFPPAGQASTTDIVESFCCHVHFLAGEDAATEWVSRSPGTFALDLDDAFELGRLSTRAFCVADGGC
jgi:alkylmercury lyase